MLADRNSLLSYTPLYLATPYTAYAPDTAAGYADAARIVARLLDEGIYVYSPIVYTHPLAEAVGLNALDHDLWMAYDEAMMRVCPALLVGMLPGWSASRGVQGEVEYFRSKTKPILYLDPDTMAVLQ